MEDIRQFVIDALARRRGDDLPRARAAFRSLTPAQMQEPFCGVSRATVLAEYEAHEARVDAAIAWVRAA